MATRFYLGGAAETTPISPTPDSAWEDTTILARARARTTPSGRAMTTVSFADNNAANRDVLFMQFVSHPLAGSQTITGSQALKAQALCKQRATTNNMLLSLGIRVIAANGTTVQKTVLSVTRDGAAADATALTNRQFTATSAVTNYTTVAGDYIVIEIGMSGDPNVGNDHDSDIRLGDAAASDLPEDDTDTSDLRPWVELVDTLTFTGETSTVTVAEAMTISDAMGKTPVHVVAESETIAEAIIRIMTKMLAETMTVSDAFTAELLAGALLETIAEQMTINEALVRAVTKVMAESETVEEALNRIVSKIITEPVSLSDATALAYTKVVAEPVTPSESIMMIVTKVLSESMTVTEAITTALLWQQIIAEAITLAEAKLLTMTHIVSESMAVVETVSAAFPTTPYGLRLQPLSRLVGV